jgi:hypothetical protein
MQVHGDRGVGSTTRIEDLNRRMVARDVITSIFGRAKAWFGSAHREPPQAPICRDTAPFGLPMVPSAGRKTTSLDQVRMSGVKDSRY